MQISTSAVNLHNVLDKRTQKGDRAEERHLESEMGNRKSTAWQEAGDLSRDSKH